MKNIFLAMLVATVLSAIGVSAQVQAGAAAAAQAGAVARAAVVVSGLPVLVFNNKGLAIPATERVTVRVTQPATVRAAPQAVAVAAGSPPRAVAERFHIPETHCEEIYVVDNQATCDKEKAHAMWVQRQSLRVNAQVAHAREVQKK